MPATMDNRKLFKICIVLFVLSAGVRFLVWQNNKVAMAGVQYVVTEGYQHDAGLLLDGNLPEFLSGPNPPSDANILLHPPGYPIFLATVRGIVGDSVPVQAVQILVNSLTPLLIFLLAASLFGIGTGTIAGSFAALSPQFAYHSGIILPDELSVLPLLLAVFAFAYAYKMPNLKWAVMCGVTIGASCWLRANALLLPVFFAIAAVIVLPRSTRLRFAGVLLAAFILTISPIAIRNYLVFDTFIPLSLGTGTTFVEGLADLDAEGTRALPRTDEDVRSMDAEHFGQPDYHGTLYSPDGVMRDRSRVSFGLGVVRSEPLWFFGGVLKRGIGTIRMERVPVIAPERDEAETTAPILYYLNIPLKLFQRLFITAVFLPLMVIGAIFLLITRESRGKFLVLSVVPIYYMSVQPLIHTEYRYVLPAAHVFIIFAAVAVSLLGGWIVKRVFDRSNLNGVAGPE